VDDESEEFESIPSSRRPRPPLIPKLVGVLFGVLIGVTLIALVLLLAGQLSRQSRLSQPPVVAETPPPNAPSEASATASQEPSITPKETSTSPRGATAPADETNAPPQAGTGKGARDARPGLGLGATGRPRPSAPPRSRQVAGVASPGTATSEAAPDPRRAELVGAPVSRGWGDSYTVRVLDSAGRPMVDANVLLVARMADGTVQNIAMGALTEPGTYRGTMPTNGSTSVDLRVRVAAGGGFVEIPVRP